MIPKQVSFQKLEIGQEFECYGDTFIGYHYPKICKCIKIDNDRAKEIDGVNFFVEPSDLVTIKVEKL